MSLFKFLIFCLPITLAFAQFSAGQTHYSRPVGSATVRSHPYNSVGLVQTVFGQDVYRGSAAVARDPRLLYSCAHLVYDFRLGWASRFAFIRAYYNYYAPRQGSYVVARGYRILSGYAPTRFFDDFDDDFAVAYGGANRSFGPPLSIHGNPVGAVSSGSLWKIILGYPSDLDHVRQYDTGRYYMYRTGPFLWSYEDDDDLPGGHYTQFGITTGSGNSGGPMVVYNPSAGRYELAAILVSGSFLYRSSGVNVLGGEAALVAQDALGRSVGGTDAFRGNRRRGWLGNRYSVWNFRFGTVPPQTTHVSLDLDIYTPRVSDVDAYLRSPNGRVRVIAKPNPANLTPNLILRSEDLSNAFLYANARGSWQLFLRDGVPGNPSWFEGARLLVRSRWDR